MHTAWVGGCVLFGLFSFGDPIYDKFVFNSTGGPPAFFPGRKNTRYGVVRTHGGMTHKLICLRRHPGLNSDTALTYAPKRHGYLVDALVHLVKRPFGVEVQPW